MPDCDSKIEWTILRKERERERGRAKESRRERERQGERAGGREFWESKRDAWE